MSIIVKILEIGIAGLAFLLAYMAYELARKQLAESSIVRTFMLFSIILLSLVILSNTVELVLTKFYFEPKQIMLNHIIGKILIPEKDSKIGRTIRCSGNLYGIQSGFNAWLMIETEKGIWPKEGEIDPDHQGNWSLTVFEDGKADVVSLSLWVGDKDAYQLIREWLRKGREKNMYLPISKTSGMRRLDRVDGLSLQSS